MTEAALTVEDTKSWTCDRCEVTVQWMAGHEAAVDLPDNWVREGELLHCLGCRRDVAAESALIDLPEKTPLNDRVKLQSQARIEFEIQRVPEKTDGEVAKACRSSAAAVKKARVRLGLVGE